MLLSQYGTNNSLALKSIGPHLNLLFELVYFPSSIDIQHNFSQQELGLPVLLHSNVMAFQLSRINIFLYLQIKQHETQKKHFEIVILKHHACVHEVQL